MLRALGEFEIEGVRTTIPAHLALLAHRRLRAPSTHSTKWVEDEVDPSTLRERRAAAAAVAAPGDGEADAALVERTVPVEVDGKRFTVKVWLPDAPVAGARPRRRAPARAPSPAPRRQRRRRGDGTITAPMQGTIVKVLVEVGDDGRGRVRRCSCSRR